MKPTAMVAMATSPKSSGVNRRARIAVLAKPSNRMPQRMAIIHTEPLMSRLPRDFVDSVSLPAMNWS